MQVAFCSSRGSPRKGIPAWGYLRSISVTAVLYVLAIVVPGVFYKFKCDAMRFTLNLARVAAQR